MLWLRATAALVGGAAIGVVLLSGGSGADPRTPPALPGLPPPFLGTTVVGDGGLTAAIDAYGGVVDLRTTPAGRALVANPATRQVAGTVRADTGIVPWVWLRGGSLPLWQADWVRQSYRSGTNVVVTAAGFGRVRATVVCTARGPGLACATRTTGTRVNLRSDAAAAARLRSDDRGARRLIRAAERADRRWLAHARPLGPAAPPWAREMYERSLLTLRALTDRRTGAVAAGARDGWAYVWPRDAGAVALAFAAAGYRFEARQVARFLLALDLGAAARFHGDGTPVPGREAQGDASGWVAVAARAANLQPPGETLPWRDRADYQERDPGLYLANALAAPVDGPKAALYQRKSARRQERAWIVEEFEGPEGLVRRAGDPGSGLDSAAAWAVRPFQQPGLYPAARRTLLQLTADRTRFGITPSEDWDGIDPWTAPTAWSAWGLAALSNDARQPNATAERNRRAALTLLAALRRAATPTGALPERVDARTGIPRSTTPLAWSHAFAVLSLRELWP